MANTTTQPPPVNIQGRQGFQGVIGGPLDKFLEKQGSPLAGSGFDFVQAGNTYGVDPRILIAIAGAETNYGKYGPSQAIHNPFGLGPGKSYPTYRDAIFAAAKSISAYKIHPNGTVSGNDIETIGHHWAPVGAHNDPTGLNQNWVKNVVSNYNNLNKFLSANSIGPIGGVILAPIHAVQSAISGFGSILDVLKLIFSIRGAYFLGGGVAGILGIIVLAKSLGSTTV